MWDESTHRLNCWASDAVRITECGLWRWQLTSVDAVPLLKNALSAGETFIFFWHLLFLSGLKECVRHNQSQSMFLPINNLLIPFDFFQCWPWRLSFKCDHLTLEEVELKLNYSQEKSDLIYLGKVVGFNYLKTNQKYVQYTLLLQPFCISSQLAELRRKNLRVLSVSEVFGRIWPCRFFLGRDNGSLSILTL